MAKFVEVTLVKEVTDGTTEDFEAATSQEGGYTVIGESKGVTRAEFYAASNTMYRPSLVVTIWADEYDGETAQSSTARLYRDSYIPGRRQNRIDLSAERGRRECLYRVRLSSQETVSPTCQT